MAEAKKSLLEVITEPPDNKRNLKGRALRDRVPKPNIIRIEVLDGASRERYLGGIGRYADRYIKQKVYDNIKSAEYSVFYGFVKNGGTQAFKLTADWSKNTGSGGPLGMIGTVAKSISPDIIGGAMDTIDAVSEIARDMTGISGSLTGTATVKKFNGNDITGFTVDCGWYLPEQLGMCTTSLEILTRMAYPEQVNQDQFTNTLGALVDVTTQAGGVVNDERIRAGVPVTVPPTQAGKEATEKSADKTNTGYIQSKIIDGARAGGDMLNGLNAILGKNLTIDPLPVRVSIGHYMDVEPMVINSINVTFSKEQFISASGRYLPLFCTVNIDIGFWCLPAPRLEFFQILGKEMFGQETPTVAKLEESIPTPTPPPLETGVGLDEKKMAALQGRPF